MNHNLKSLLENPTNVQNLLINGTIYGLHFRKTNSSYSNIINLGIIDKDTLDNDIDHIYVPLGYENIEETENETSRKLYIDKISLSFQDSSINNSNISTAKLINFQQFPNNLNNDIILSIIEDNDVELTNISININEKQTFYIKLSINSSYSGPIKRLLIFTFDIIDDINILVTKKVTITMGVLLIGTIITNQINKLSNIDCLQLNNINNIITINNNDNNNNNDGSKIASINARSFNPMCNINLFDKEV